MSGVEQFVFYFGAIALILIFGTIVSLLVVMFGCFVKRKVDRYKRMKKSTMALWCGRCQDNVDGKCKRFGLTIAHAPYRRPGCSWGVEKKEVRDD